jgi:hypothetical protein
MNRNDDFMARQLARLNLAIELLNFYRVLGRYEPAIPAAPKKRKKPRSKPYRKSSGGFKRLW